MKIADISEKLKLKALTSRASDGDAESAFVGDMLSDAMANAPEGCIWVTIQIHQNIIAVAMLRNCSAIIIANDRKPPSELISKASESGVTIFSSEKSAFELCGLLHRLGLRG